MILPLRVRESLPDDLERCRPHGHADAVADVVLDFPRNGLRLDPRILPDDDQEHRDLPEAL